MDGGSRKPSSASPSRANVSEAASDSAAARLRCWDSREASWASRFFSGVSGFRGFRALGLGFWVLRLWV